MSASNVTRSSQTLEGSSLRPRNRRLISGLDDVALEPATSSSSRMPSPTPGQYGNRVPSPIPPAHPQRQSPAQTADRRTIGASFGREGLGGQKNAAKQAPLFTNLWGHSWNTLQGIASDFLGTEPPPAQVRDKPRARKPLSKLHAQRASSSGPASTWGPSVSSTSPSGSGRIGIGTREEQTAAFRAQKKKDMLTGRDSSYADALGKFKRRYSDDRASASAPPADNEDREALAYVHHVHKDDTLAGITLRYNIAANALRKANRMWPNDTVQIRQTLVLPVDACGIKGRPCPGPGEAIDLLGLENESLSTLHAEEVPANIKANLLSNGSNSAHNRSRDSVSTNTTSSAAASHIETDLPWQHDSWVLLPGSTKPTEIVRLQRRALGYFPPARRKSQNFSDLETPSTSFDLSRNDIASPTLQTPPRPARRLSNATNGYYPAYLTGPGGVGSMGKNVHCPGPAQDGLNKLFAKHLPDVAPPRNQSQLYHPDIPLYSDEVPTPVASGIVTPAYPAGGNGAGGAGMGLENVGGVIESWVRRMAKNPLPRSGSQRAIVPRASIGAEGRGVDGMGDLIELTDEFEIGGDEDEEASRGRVVSGPSGGNRLDDLNGTVRRNIGKSGKAD